MDLDQISRWPGKSPVEDEPAHLLQDDPHRDLFCLLIAVHDLGKIGLPFRNALQNDTARPWRHREMTEAHLHEPQILQLLAQHLGGSNQALLPLIAAIAGHHGRPPTADPQRDFLKMRRAAGAEAQADAAAFVRTCLGLWPTMPGSRVCARPRPRRSAGFWPGRRRWPTGLDRIQRGFRRPIPTCCWMTILRRRAGGQGQRLQRPGYSLRPIGMRLCSILPCACCNRQRVTSCCLRGRCWRSSRTRRARARLRPPLSRCSGCFAQARGRVSIWCCPPWPRRMRCSCAPAR